MLREQEFQIISRSPFEVVVRRSFMNV